MIEGWVWEGRVSRHLQNMTISSLPDMFSINIFSFSSHTPYTASSKLRRILERRLGPREVAGSCSRSDRTVLNEFISELVNNLARSSTRGGGMVDLLL